MNEWINKWRRRKSVQDIAGISILTTHFYNGFISINWKGWIQIKIFLKESMPFNLKIAKNYNSSWFKKLIL